MDEVFLPHPTVKITVGGTERRFAAAQILERGNSALQVLRRYLTQTTEDIAQAHRKRGLVDNNRPHY